MWGKRFVHWSCKLNVRCIAGGAHLPTAVDLGLAESRLEEVFS